MSPTYLQDQELYLHEQVRQEFLKEHVKRKRCRIIQSQGWLKKIASTVAAVAVLLVVIGPVFLL